MNKLNILVLDGRSRSTYQIIKSLSKSSNIHVGESDFCPAFLSNQIYKKLRYTDPELNPKLFLEQIVDYLKLNNIDLLIPTRDITSRIISKNKSIITNADCSVVIEDYSKFSLFELKSNTIDFAKEMGIRVPKTIKLSEKSDFQIIKKKLGLPFILKPVFSSGSRGISLINSKSEFEMALSLVNNMEHLLQEFIPYGGAIGVYLISHEGKVLARNCHLRLREFPVSGGPSTYRKSIFNNKCEKIALKMIRKSEWSGVAMVEFRIHEISKKPYLMEVNPRFWGSLSLDLHSKVNFPQMLVNMAFKGTYKNIYNKRETSKYTRWLILGDMLWFLFSKKTENKFSTFFNFSNQKFDYLNYQDPLPAISHFSLVIRSLFNINFWNRSLRRGW